MVRSSGVLLWVIFSSSALFTLVEVVQSLLDSWAPNWDKQASSSLSRFAFFASTIKIDMSNSFPDRKLLSAGTETACLNKTPSTAALANFIPSTVKLNIPIFILRSLPRSGKALKTDLFVLNS
jgi:hypothetical protein